MKPILSIVITTFKRNDYLFECLDSIYASISYYRSNSKNNFNQIEIVITDDDPKQTKEFIQEINSKYEKRDERCRLIYHKNLINKGDYFNRNIGINLASGQWLKFIDDDDLIYDFSINYILSAIEQNHKKLNLNTIIFYLRDNFRHLKFPISLDSEGVLDFHYLNYGLFHCSLVSAVFKREELLNSGGFFCKRFYGDFFILNKLAIAGEFIIYPMELGYYRMHENQESGYNRKHDEIRFNYILITADLISKLDYYEKYRSIIKNDNFNFLKRGVKTLNLNLIINSTKLYFYLKSEKSIKNNQSGWNKFFKKNISIYGNEIKT